MFFTPDGKSILERPVTLQNGLTTLRLQNQDLGYKGLLFYALIYRDSTSGVEKRVWNKMVVQ